MSQWVSDWSVEKLNYEGRTATEGAMRAHWVICSKNIIQHFLYSKQPWSLCMGLNIWACCAPNKSLGLTLRGHGLPIVSLYTSHFKRDAIAKVNQIASHHKKEGNSNPCAKSYDALPSWEATFFRKLHQKSKSSQKSFKKSENFASETST